VGEVRLDAKTPANSSHIQLSFLLDTGARRTILMPKDWKRLLRQEEFNKLEDEGPVQGATGLSGLTKKLTVTLWFQDDDKGLLVGVVMEVVLMPYTDAIKDNPSLLGRDFMSLCHVVYDIPNYELTLDSTAFTLTSSYKTIVV
tara:strand:+ start:323 stop:751 length:429 start_codon:yes stop_codon:yes gene_type:complete